MEAFYLSGQLGIAQVDSLITSGLCLWPRNGSFVRISEDPWVPGEADNFPVWKAASVLPINCHTVADLVRPDGVQWDVELLWSLFAESTVEIILRMPIPNPLMADKWIWTLEKNGEFSVKSLVLSQQRLRAPDHAVLDSGTWMRLWKLKLQDKLKLLLWKVATGAMRTMGALGRILHTEFEEGFLCLLCGQMPEDAIHLFVHCSVANIAWRESPGAVQIDMLSLDSTATLISTVLHADSVLHLDKDNLKAFALNATVVLDSLWFLRNKITHEGARVDILGLIDTIKRRYAEHSYAWGVVGRGSGLRWVPLVVGFLKLNSDVAIRPNGSYITILVRDSSNSLRMAYMERLIAIDPLVGEASALAEAMALARRRKWLRVEMETDSLVLYKEVLCEAPPSWEIASLVEFIRLGLREFKE